MDQVLAAIRSGSLEQVEGLLTSDPSLASSKDADGRTIIHYAVTFKQPIILKFLLSKYPKGSMIADDAGWSPLHIAASSGSEESVNLLLAVFNGKGPEASVFVNLCNSYNQSALFYAVSKGHPNIVKILLDFGASLEIRNGHGQTVLHRAATVGNAIILKELLPKSTNQIDWTDKNGNTALHLAVEDGHEDAVRLLLSSKANRNIPNSEGKVPLSLAPSDKLCVMQAIFSEIKN